MLPLCWSVRFLSASTSLGVFAVLHFDKEEVLLYLRLFSFPFLLCDLVYSYRNTQIRASALTDQPLARLYGFQISLATV